MVRKVKEVVKRVKKPKVEKMPALSSSEILIVTPDVAFYSIDGNKMHSLMELADALEMMSDDTFFYHVTEHKNDFANWVKDVFKEADLAERMLRANSAQRMQIMVLRHLLNKLL